MNLTSRFEKNIALAVFIAGILMLANCQSPAESITPVNLQCEFRSNPRGIDAPQPRLIWQVLSEERNQWQTAYEILVASSSELLQHNRGDLWDSGRISSNETVNILYAGKPLASGAHCFWKVRVWDKDGKASDWSAPALWTMGLLEPGDWRGKWIGSDQGGRTNDLGGAKWMWFPEGNPAERAPVCTRYFRRVFELPANEA